MFAVVCTIFGRNFNFVNLFSRQANTQIKILLKLKPFLELFFPVVWMHKELNLHLFEFTNTKNEITRANLIAKRLPYLSQREWQIWTKAINNILKVHKHTLCGFRTEITNTIFVFSSTNCCFEHHIELANLTERIAVWTRDALFCNDSIHLLNRHSSNALNTKIFK